MLLTEPLILLVFGVMALVLWLLLNLLWDALRPIARLLCRRLVQTIPSSLRSKIEIAAQRSGHTYELEDYIAKQSLMLMTLLISLLLPLPTYVAWLAVGFICLQFLHARGQRRHALRAFERQWPNCLDMLAMLMRSGLSFAAALHVLSQQSNESIAFRQLRQVQQQVHAGVALDTALKALHNRLPSQFLPAFAAAVVQARSSGAALGQTLMLQAEQARSEQQLAAEKFAQEIGVKLLLPLVTCFFPVTFLLILGPIFIGFLDA